jgi:hypothetical protein
MSPPNPLPKVDSRVDLVHQIRAEAIEEWRNSARQSRFGKWSSFGFGIVGALVGATAAGIAAASLSAGWTAGLAALAGVLAALQTDFRPGEQRVWHAHQAAGYRTIIHEADLLLLRGDELTDDDVHKLLRMLEVRTQRRLDVQPDSADEGDQPD